MYLIRDIIVPDIVISGGNIITNGGSVSLSATASDSLSGLDSSTWQYSYNGGANVNGSSFALSKEGSYVVTFHVRDNVKNLGLKSTNVVIDRTAPVISVSGGPGSGWSNAASLTLSASATDALSGLDTASWQYSTNGGSSWSAEGSGNNKVTLSAEGSYTVLFRVRDKAGNTQTSTSQIKLDRKPPVITGFAPPSSGWLRRDFQFSGIKVKDSVEAAAANAGVNASSMQIIPEGQAAISISPAYDSTSGTVGAFTAANLPDGKYNLAFSVADNAGNRGQASTTVQIDGTAPAFTAAINGHAKRNGTGWIIPLALSGVQDNHSGINQGAWKYSIDGGSETTFSVTGSGSSLTANIRIGTLAGTSHSLRISAADNAGNKKTLDLAFVLDITAPVISYDGLMEKTVEAAKWINSSALTIGAADTESGLGSFTGEIKRRQANGTWSVTTDAVFSTGKITFTAGTADGIFQILLKAEDNAGNIKEETLYARIDRTPPVITVPSGISTTVAISGNGSDTMSGIVSASWEWRAGDGPWQQGNTAVLTEGRTLSFGFRVKDNAGNVGEKNGTITVDLNPPQVSAVVSAYAKEGNLFIDELQASDSITGIDGIWYQIDGGSKQPIEGTKAISIPIGSYGEGRRRMLISAEDGAAHIGTSDEYIFIIDRTPPRIDKTEIRDGQDPERILQDDDYIVENKITINLESSDWYKDGEVLQKGEVLYWYWTLGQEETAAPEFSETRRSSQSAFAIEGFVQGLNYLFVCAEDRGGNRSPVIRRIVSRDSNIPSMPVIKSSTHGEARRVEQAGFLTEAEFQFRPAYRIPSGIKAYKWGLTKIIIRNGLEGRAELVMEGIVSELNEEGKGALHLSLEDNAEDEFYRLSVQCISGNRLTGAASEYQFRIDTNPPRDLRIWMSPQTDSGAWYNNGEALVMWNKPSDMTGVAEYRYRISGDPLPPMPEDGEELRNYS
ncbi:MAG: Ig-like domain repeat protein, partial [Treponema sp.]|nr:Ig-like domain repeat protein [Treponema sp.]